MFLNSGIHLTLYRRWFLCSSLTLYRRVILMEILVLSPWPIYYHNQRGNIFQDFLVILKRLLHDLLGHIEGVFSVYWWWLVDIVILTTRLHRVKLELFQNISEVRLMKNSIILVIYLCQIALYCCEKSLKAAFNW